MFEGPPSLTGNQNHLLDMFDGPKSCCYARFGPKARRPDGDA
uniref:Uncharacterized protein n=1 Tax=Arundo donax TaxID=35708 RepID=A0A0A9B4L7_ARUDO